MSTATEPKYKWTLIHRSPDGHSFWRNESDYCNGYISIKDRSGDTPETTDDGVLWVSEDGEWEILDGDFVRIPVFVERSGKWASCGETLVNGIECAIALKKRVAVKGEHTSALPLATLARLLAASKQVEFKF